MKKQTVFKGVATALITPTTETGIDFAQFGRLIDWQIAQGVNALVICGTTGEGATLSQEEYEKAIRFSVQQVAGRVPVIAGAGSNNTQKAIAMTKFCCQTGADAILSVTPYYNKTTQRGLVAMYEAIADASSKPVIVYNMPSRTGVNIEPETYRELARHPRIVGIKEANGDLSKILQTMALVEDSLDLYSGNDDQTYPILAMGGKGVISVLSNVAPRATAEMCNRFFEGDWEGSRKLQYEFLPMISALFSEVNPIPVKAALAKLGFCENRVRLPLVTMSPDKAQKLYDLMDQASYLHWED